MYWSCATLLQPAGQTCSDTGKPSTCHKHPAIRCVLVMCNGSTSNHQGTSAHACMLIIYPGIKESDHSQAAGHRSMSEWRLESYLPSNKGICERRLSRVGHTDHAGSQKPLLSRFHERLGGFAVYPMLSGIPKLGELFCWCSLCCVEEVRFWGKGGKGTRSAREGTACRMQLQQLLDLAAEQLAYMRRCSHCCRTLTSGRPTEHLLRHRALSCPRLRPAAI